MHDGGSDQLRWVAECYLASYLTMESLIPGFVDGGPGWPRRVRYGRPKGGVGGEIILGVLGVDALAAALEQLVDTDTDDAFVSACTVPGHAGNGRWGAAGYELASSNVLMTLELVDTGAGIDPSVREATTTTTLEWLAAIRDDGEPRTIYLTNPAVRCFYLDFDGVPVASALLIAVGERTVVVDEVLTLPDHRRNGHGQRLLRSMHATAATGGATGTVLAATDDGRGLYLALGYREVGEVLVFQRATGVG